MKPTVKTLFIITILLFLSFENVEAQSTDTTSTMVSVLDSVFTVMQVERGKNKYEESCGGCHMPEQFIGPAFMDAWKGQTVYDLIILIRTTMPYDKPNSLKSSIYVDILAYLFKLNGLPSGSTEMPNSARRLKQIRIDSVTKGRNKK